MKTKLTLLSFAGFVSLAICLTIEFLNWRAGGILPRDLPQQGNPKWRVSAMSVRRISYEREYRSDHSIDPDEPLPAAVTQAIDRRMTAEASRHRAESRLRDAVGSWGLLQYPLSIVLVIAGIAGTRSAEHTKARAAHCTVAAIGAGSLVIALYRGYFASLGW